MPDLPASDTVSLTFEGYMRLQAAARDVERVTRERDALRDQAERYRLQALRLAAQVDPEEFGEEWEAELKQLTSERDALRETRSELNLRINRALAALAKGGVEEARGILNRGSQ